MKKTRQETRPVAGIAFLILCEPPENDQIPILKSDRGLQGALSQRRRVVDSRGGLRKVAELLIDGEVNDAFLYRRLYVEDNATATVLDALNRLAIVGVAHRTQDRHVLANGKRALSTRLDAQAWAAHDLESAVLTEHGIHRVQRRVFEAKEAANRIDQADPGLKLAAEK